MGAPARIPPYRSLDIYRLVVVRGLKQCEVAESFGITPQRVCQVVRRVRQWVNESIGDWLFKGRDDLRFYVALQCEGIRPDESPDEPESIVLAGPGWRYSRRTTDVSEPESAAEHWQD